MNSRSRIGGLAMAMVLVAGAARADSGALRWFPPRLQGWGVVLVPKAYHSSDNGLGLGMEAVRPYRFPGSTAAANDSEFRVKGRLNDDGHGAAEVGATVQLGEGRWFTKAKFSYEALALRYWGIGPDTPSEAEETYRPQNVSAYVEVFHRLFASLLVGVRGEWQDYRYLEMERGGLLETERASGTVVDRLLGTGFVVEWDSRDDRYAPRRGVHAQAFWMWFGNHGSDSEFVNGHVDLSAYFDLGGDNVLAMQGFTYAVFDDGPIWRYASIGGRAHSRGYRRDRYLDRRMVAAQVEWRRPLVERIDVVGFGGLAIVAPDYDEFSLADLRPTLGGGLRVYPSDRRDVMVRVDLAFGEESMRTYLSLGHAF